MSLSVTFFSQSEILSSHMTDGFFFGSFLSRCIYLIIYLAVQIKLMFFCGLLGGPKLFHFCTFVSDSLSFRETKADTDLRALT